MGTVCNAQVHHERNTRMPLSHVETTDNPHSVSNKAQTCVWSSVHSLTNPNNLQPHAQETVPVPLPKLSLHTKCACYVAINQVTKQSV